MGGSAPGVGLVLGGPGTEDGEAEREEGAEVGEVDGRFRWESAGVVGHGALVGKDPQVKFLHESDQVAEFGVLRLGEGADPEVGEDLDWVFLH